MYKFKASLANLLVPQLYCAARVFRSCCPDGGFWCDAGERGLSIPCLLQDERWDFSDPLALFCLWGKRMDFKASFLATFFAVDLFLLSENWEQRPERWQQGGDLPLGTGRAGPQPAQDDGGYSGIQRGCSCTQISSSSDQGDDSGKQLSLLGAGGALTWQDPLEPRCMEPPQETPQLQQREPIKKE